MLRYTPTSSGPTSSTENPFTSNHFSCRLFRGSFRSDQQHNGNNIRKWSIHISHLLDSRRNNKPRWINQWSIRHPPPLAHLQPLRRHQEPASNSCAGWYKRSTASMSTLRVHSYTRQLQAEPPYKHLDSNQQLSDTATYDPTINEFSSATAVIMATVLVPVAVGTYAYTKRAKK